MLRISILYRTFLLGLSFMAMPAALGFFISPKFGTPVGALLGLCLLLWVAVSVEKKLARAHLATSSIPIGLKRSLDRVLEEVGGESPWLMIIPAPVNEILVERALLGRGLILISQGIISKSDEPTLRAELKAAIAKIRKPGIVLQSTCESLVFSILKRAPKGWVRLAASGELATREASGNSLSPASVLILSMTLVPARFFLSLGGVYAANSPETGLYFALRKVSLSLSIGR